MRKENKQAIRLSARRVAQGSHFASISLKLMSSYVALTSSENHQWFRISIPKNSSRYHAKRTKK